MIRDWAEEKVYMKVVILKLNTLKLMEEAGEVGRAILKEDDT